MPEHYLYLAARHAASEAGRHPAHAGATPLTCPPCTSTIPNVRGGSAQRCWNLIFNVDRASSEKIPLKAPFHVQALVDHYQQDSSFLPVVGRLLTCTVPAQLETEREAIPDVPAIYFCRPTADNMRRIAADAGKRLYRQVPPVAFRLVCQEKGNGQSLGTLVHPQAVAVPYVKNTQNAAVVPNP